MTQQKRLLATTVDDHAKHNPSNVFAVIPQGAEVSHGFRSLSMKDLAQAVNGMCWWVEETIGSAQSPETLAYMGGNDVRYFIFMLACQKTGYQVRTKIAEVLIWRLAKLFFTGFLAFDQELGRSSSPSTESDELHQVLLQRGATSKNS